MYAAKVFWSLNVSTDFAASATDFTETEFTTTGFTGFPACRVGETTHATL